jgi:hypothetical protein
MNQPLACLAKSRHLSWEDKIAYLAYKLKSVESPVDPIEHRFEPGWYIRKMTIPAKSIFVGRPHRYGHMCKLLEGTLAILQPEGEYYFYGPSEMHTTPGYQTVCTSITTCVAETWHPNPSELRDVKLLEDDIFLPADEVLQHGELVAIKLEDRLVTAEGALQ